MIGMAVTAKKLDVKVGDLVEIEGRKYDVVSDKHGGVALEPAITATADEILADHGLHPLTPEEFEEEFGPPLRRRGLGCAASSPRRRARCGAD